MLVVPASAACCERGFSVLTAVKSQSRNRIKDTNLVACMTITDYIQKGKSATDLRWPTIMQKWVALRHHERWDTVDGGTFSRLIDLSKPLQPEEDVVPLEVTQEAQSLSHPSLTSQVANLFRVIQKQKDSKKRREKRRLFRTYSKKAQRKALNDLRQSRSSPTISESEPATSNISSAASVQKGNQPPAKTSTGTHLTSSRLQLAECPPSRTTLPSQASASTSLPASVFPPALNSVPSSSKSSSSSKNEKRMLIMTRRIPKLQKHPSNAHGRTFTVKQNVRS